MDNIVWEILGIDPTTDKKEIQKAYADKLKIYHPEDNPQEFQWLQEAYREASAYAKKQKTHTKLQPLEYSVKPTDYDDKLRQARKLRTEQVQSEEKAEEDAEEIRPQRRTTRTSQTIRTEIANEESSPEEKKKRRTIRVQQKVRDEIKAATSQEEEAVLEETILETEPAEPIPEYISQLGNTELQELKADEIEKYVAILKEQLLRKKGKENIRELAVLFENLSFRNVLNLDAFRIHFRDETMYYSKWNQRVLQFLIKKIRVMMREETEHNLRELYGYLYRRSDTKSLARYVVFACIAGWIIRSLGMLLPLPTRDVTLFVRAPQSEEICQMLQEQYEIEMNPEDIEWDCVKNGDVSTVDNNPEIVRYKIPYTVEGVSYDFRGTYYPHEDEVVFDVEMELMRQEIEAYLNCDYFHHLGITYSDGYALYPELISEEEKEEFIQIFERMLEDLFSNSLMAQSDFTYCMEIAFHGIESSVVEYVNHENYAEICATLSEKLEPVMLEANLFKAYENGLIDAREYVDRLWELENKQYSQ